MGLQLQEQCMVRALLLRELPKECMYIQNFRHGVPTICLHSGKAIALRLAHDGFDLCINDLEGNFSMIEDVRMVSSSLPRKQFT